MCPSRDGGDDEDLAGALDRGVEAGRIPAVVAVHIDVHEPAQLAALVQQQVGDGETAERIAHGRRLDLELSPTVGLVGQE
jgi:hypothetical protein